MGKLFASIKPLSFSNIFLLVICTCSVSMYLGGAQFYLLLITIALFQIFKRWKNKCDFNKGALGVLAIAFVSILYNYPETPQYFRVEQRFILLFIIIWVFSPAITNNKIYTYRKRLFYFLTAGLSIVGILSALLSFVGFGYVDFYLRGLSDFPNSLGYTLGITMIFSFSIMTQVQNKYIKILCLIIIALCYRTIPLTGTRTAFYSIPIFIVTYLFFSSKNFVSVIKKLFLFSPIIIVALLIIDVDMSIIDKKNELQRETGENSRSSLFYARQKEFEQSPIIGYGTFRGDPRYAIINNNGNVEVGNTFLAFLSMNGILGFINFIFLYLFLVVPFIIYILKKKKYGLSSFEMLLLLVVIYNFISMQQMGLALNPGLYSTGYNWLILGLIFKPNKYLNRYRNEQQTIFY